MSKRITRSNPTRRAPSVDHRLLCAGLLVLGGSAGPALAGRLLAVDSSRAFYEIDMLSGAKTLLGTVSSNAGTTGGLAYDRATRRMFVTSTSLDQVFTLDLNTLNATLIGGYGDPAVVMHGLEFDESTGTLYGASSHNGGLYQISQTTGFASLIGTTGLTSFVNLGYNSITNLLYATSSGTDTFHLIDRATGAGTLIGPLIGPTNPNGLAFNFQTNQMFLVDNATDSLYTINMITGQATLVGSTGPGNLLGLAYVPARELIWNGLLPMNQWNTNPGNLNWLDGPLPAHFMNGDIANFTQIAVGLVQVDALGVIPESTNISNVSGTYTFIGGPIGGGGAVTKTGAGEAILNNNNTFTGGVFVNGGVLGVFQDTNLGAPVGAIHLGGGTLRVLSGGFSSARNVNAAGGSVEIPSMNVATLSGSITGPGTLSKIGAGTLNVTNVRSSGLNVADGDVKVMPGPAPSHPSGVSIVSVLLIAGGPALPTARLDLTNNAMIVGSAPTDGGPDAEAVIGAYISSGYAGGSWAGKGINSSSADRGAPTYGLGYGEAGALGITNFLGFPVLPTDTLIRFTIYGDANLDGAANFPDFNILAANFGTTAGAVWRRADFNYDGRVNILDFDRLAGNFGLVAAPDGPTPEDWAALAAAVPEPVGLIGLVTAGAAALWRRRRL